MPILIYKNLENKSFEKLSNQINWNKQTSIKKNKFHSICSYLAMFSHSLPNYFIKKYSNIGDVVYDPFSGRGTTLLEARLEKRKAIASDLNPLAIVLSKAKANKLSKIAILKRIEQIRDEFLKSNVGFNEDYYQQDFSGYYSKHNFIQLLFLRNYLGSQWQQLDEIDNFILAITLGIMFGPGNKNGVETYFSVSAPNTISMSPEYVKKYVISNNLKQPENDVFKLIKRRIEAKFDKELFDLESSLVFAQNAIEPIAKKHIKPNSIQLIVTSPPYLSTVNYTRSNWLRLWLLGFERQNLKEIKLDDKLSLKKYLVFLKQFLENVYPLLKHNGKVCLVVGDVKDMMSLENVWKEIENDLINKYVFKELYVDQIQQENKTTNFLGTKAGKKTNVEKVLVLKVIKKMNNEIKKN